ncbi:serine hydrolase [Candidatus Gottesmanbacteria bacterium]|nr:serine hydrolase [Candidatus Gottesmanbacteria bacterium]
MELDRRRLKAHSEKVSEMVKRPYFLIINILLGLGALAIIVWALPKLPTLSNFAQQKTPLSLTSPVPSPQISLGDEAQLKKYLTVEAALLGVADNISLFFKDVNQKKEVTIDPTRAWIPASTIKAYVVLEAFRQRRGGLIDFSQTVKISADNVVPTELETDECPRLREGTQITLSKLVECMIIQSDNTAYNTLLDILDRRNINAAMRAIGITETVVGEKLNLDDDQLGKDLKAPGRQSNTTTAQDLATFFDFLFSKKFPESEEMLAIFKRQKINTMIPAFLPEDVAVAHKTGDWAPIYHDGGIIYKPTAPFILTVFTNSNNPRVLSHLARVAYYQEAAVVGEVDSPRESKKKAQRSEKIYLASVPLPSNVLGETTNEKSPTITAADLGITTSDITTDKEEAARVQPALVTPDSPFYQFKRNAQMRELLVATSPSQKIRAYLTLSKNRLAEVKTLLGRGDVDGIGALLDESEDDLKQATRLVEADPNSESELLEIKHVSDLHFSVLAEAAGHLDPAKKEQFVDAVYHVYQRQQKEIAPVVRTSLTANPLAQQPVIGTVQEVKTNAVILSFADGTTKEVTIPDTTPVRGFRERTLDVQKKFTVGTKMAVIGQITKEKKIFPTFILRDIPKELPEKHEGTVIEINPGQNTLEIQTNTGKKESIMVDQSTIINAKDTSVSLEGIKAGSRVTVFGNSEDLVSPSTQPLQPGGEQQKQTEAVHIQATTVTVTKNSSGKEEKIAPAKPQESQKKELPKSEQPKAPPPPQSSGKTEEKKK